MNKITVATNVDVLVEQWCKAVENMVKLKVEGSVFGDLVNGKVADCKRDGCQARNVSPFCWLNRRIQTKL